MQFTFLSNNLAPLSGILEEFHRFFNFFFLLPTLLQISVSTAHVGADWLHDLTMTPERVYASEKLCHSTTRTS